MNPIIIVREHAWLYTEPVPTSLDCAQLSESAFDYVCQLSEKFSRAGARMAQVEGRRRLKLDNYVGVLHTPCGTTLEILPKHHELDDSPLSCRALLRKMIQVLLDLPAREVDVAPIELYDAPLTEWVMQRFLDELDRLVQRGLHFDYQRVEEESPYLRGRLDLRRQLQQTPGKAHRFNVRHDVYLPDRAENRLLRLALDRIRVTTQSPENWRLAQELSVRLAEVPPSRHVDRDFEAWSTGRLIAHYQFIKPWCELILKQQMPLALLGNHWGLSMLFPMEKLFERYLARWLRRQLTPGVDLRTPAAFKSLCSHQGQDMFRLEPDFYIGRVGQRWVLDAKWKRLNTAEDKYGINQADLYQLFAYGHKYLDGQGQMALIYPRSTSFSAPLPHFEFQPGLQLQVLPFDLDADRLIGIEMLGLPINPVGQPLSSAHLL